MDNDIYDLSPVDVLTRDEAIKRINDVLNGTEVNHITFGSFFGDHLLNDCQRGAVNELMAIFDIKEEDLCLAKL